MNHFNEMSDVTKDDIENVFSPETEATYEKWESAFDKIMEFDEEMEKCTDPDNYWDLLDKREALQKEANNAWDEYTRLSFQEIEDAFEEFNKELAKEFPNEIKSDTQTFELPNEI